MSEVITMLLNQEAIEKAITDYVSDIAPGIDFSRKRAEIKLIAGRGGNGLRAEVNITERDSEADALVNTPIANDVENDVAPEEATTTEAQEEPAVQPIDFD